MPGQDQMLRAPIANVCSACEIALVGRFIHLDKMARSSATMERGDARHIDHDGGDIAQDWSLSKYATSRFCASATTSHTLLIS